MTVISHHFWWLITQSPIIFATKSCTCIQRTQSVFSHCEYNAYYHFTFMTNFNDRNRINIHIIVRRRRDIGTLIIKICRFSGLRESSRGWYNPSIFILINKMQMYFCSGEMFLKKRYCPFPGDFRLLFIITGCCIVMEAVTGAFIGKHNKIFFIRFQSFSVLFA